VRRDQVDVLNEGRLGAFRCLPVRLYRASEARSVNMGRRQRIDHPDQ
jgi:hypothetical protein